MVPLFYTWNLFSIYGPIFPHIKMVPLFDIWFLFSQTGTWIEKMVLLFCLSKRYIKGSRAYRNCWKRSGLIFFWYAFLFYAFLRQLSSPFLKLKIPKKKRKRKKRREKALRKKSRQKKPRKKSTCENRYHNFCIIEFPKSDFQISNPSFRLFKISRSRSASSIFSNSKSQKSISKILWSKFLFANFLLCIFLK